MSTGVEQDHGVVRDALEWEMGNGDIIRTGLELGFFVL